MNNKANSKYSIQLLEMAFQLPTLCHQSPILLPSHRKKGCASSTIPNQFLCGAKLDPVQPKVNGLLIVLKRMRVNGFSRAVRIGNKEMKYITHTRKRHLACTINRSFPSCLWTLLKKARPKYEVINMKIIFFKFTSEYKSSLQGRLANSMQHKNRFHYS